MDLLQGLPPAPDGACAPHAGTPSDDDPGVLGPCTRLFASLQLDSMLAMRSNQFKLLVLCVILFVTFMSIPYYFVGGAIILPMTVPSLGHPAMT